MKKFFITKPIRHDGGGWLSSETILEKEIDFILSKKPSEFDSDFKKKSFFNRIFKKDKLLKSPLIISISKNPNEGLYRENYIKDTWEKIV